MALTSESMTPADIAACCGNDNNGFGGDGAWLILFILLAMNGGWGNGFGGGFGGGMGYDFPWLMTGQQNINSNTNNGFRDAMLNDGITSVRDGISGLATQLCGCCGDMQMGMANGFSGVQMALANGFAGNAAAITGAQNGITQQLYNNEIASLNRSFAEQTANMQGFNGVNAGLADAKYVEATEACATRTAAAENTQNIITAITAGIQSIKDDLCQDRLDAERRENQNLRSELMYARGQASQVEQTAALRQGQEAEVDALYNRLKNCPVPSQPVYGNQPIFTCNGNNGCGCGCGM